MSKSKDLDINNYDLNDILALFKIQANFDEDDLRAAKKIVLKTHPDKSGLASEYFLFYSKAYKVLFSIWEFKNKSSNIFLHLLKKQFFSINDSMVQKYLLVRKR